MKTTRIRFFKTPLPYVGGSYGWSAGNAINRAMSSDVVIDTDAGLPGWGEGCPWGHTYLPAHGPGIRAWLRTLDHITRIIDLQFPGQPSVKSPIDMACWDILGQASDMPLWKLMGGQEASPVLVNPSIFTNTPDEMIALIEKAAAKGDTVHSAKVGGTDIGQGIDQINAISASLPTGHKVTFDVSRAWQPAVAIEVLNCTSALDWVEQPCETLGLCAHVAKPVSNPIMLDECMHSFGDHLEARKRTACEGVKVKPNRVGGLTKARQIRDFSVSVSWQMHLEDLGGSVLADTAAIHLAASTPDANRLASWLCHCHLSVDPVPGQGTRNTQGIAVPPSLPGLGVSPDPYILGDPVAIYSNRT
jgi:L-alanine-DL-glutamate epimerase-like enolase superfamily enzyme